MLLERTISVEIMSSLRDLEGIANRHDGVQVQAVQAEQFSHVHIKTPGDAEGEFPLLELVCLGDASCGLGDGGFLRWWRRRGWFSGCGSTARVDRPRRRGCGWDNLAAPTRGSRLGG